MMDRTGEMMESYCMKAMGYFKICNGIIILLLLAGTAAPAAADNYVGSVTVGTQVGTLNNGTAGSVTYPITVYRDHDTNNPFTAELNITSSLPAGATYSFTPSSVYFATSQSSNTSILTITTSSITPAGSTVFVVKAKREGLNNDAKTGSGVLTVVNTASKADQTIIFGALSDMIYGDPSFIVSATASSGLPVSFFASGPCSVSGSNVTITGAGSCTITANQSGNASYNPAPDVPQIFTISTKAASVTPNTAGKTYGDIDPALTGTLTGFLPADGVTATYSRPAGETAGGYTISATLDPSGVLGNYDITYNTAAFTISKASATLIFDNLAYVYDGSPKPVTVTTNPSGLDIVSITYDGSSTAPSAVGSYTVNATLTNDNYSASDATDTLVISAVPKIDQTITFEALSVKTYGDTPFGISATASSGLPVTFNIQSGPATISGATITITGAGSVTVRASQAGNDTYNAAPVVDQTFTVSPATPLITWSNPADIVYGTVLSAIQLNAAASVPGTFVYNPAAGTMLGTGTGQTLHAAFTPDDSTNYTVASKSVEINVSELPAVRYINGTVVDSESLLPLTDVKVSTTGGISSITDGSGKYSLAVGSGLYPLTASYDIRYYTNNSVTVSTEFVAVVNQDIELVLKPTGTISGSVKVGELLGWI